MWVTKLLISPVKKRIFAQKRPNLAQNWHFWSIWLGHAVASCSSKKHELVENVRLNFNRRVELKQLRQTDRDTGHRNGDWMDQEKVEADRIRWRME